MAEPLPAYVVDDDAAVCDSLVLLLGTAGFSARGFSGGRALLDSIDCLAPGPILLDLRMPPPDGLAVQQALAARGIAWPIIILTAHGDVGAAVRAMKAGACDFLEKPTDVATILGAVRSAAERMHALIREAGGTAARTQLSRLSPRELDVLRGLMRGQPNKLIAHALGISPRTVEIHRAHLMEKLEAKSLAHVIRVAVEGGLGEWLADA